MNRLKEYKFDNRIEQFEETINYLMKKKQNSQPITIHNIHFLSIHENEEMSYPEKIEKYWLNLKNKKCIKLKKNDRIEERIKQLGNKVDKFKIWKEKFSNLKLISNILDLHKTRYAIQLKESGYLIWKFLRKWKVIGEVYTKQNISTAEVKFTYRRKRRKKLNILTNLFDVGEKFISDNDIHEMI
jgi:hypothetical protein